LLIEFSPPSNQPRTLMFVHHHQDLRGPGFTYIFSLVIDSVTLHHADSPHLQHKATILHELDSMTPDAFRAELRASPTSFYEDILKVPCAGGRPQAKIIKHRKLCRRASSSRTPIAAKGGVAKGSAAADGGASADEGGAAVGNGDGGGGATTPPPPTSVP
jgi:hypothetical protein